MRHERFLIAGAAVVLMAVACDKATSITGPDAPIAGRADVVSTHVVEQDVLWPDLEWNPCNEEWVRITGSTHYVFSNVVNSGGSFDDGVGTHLSVHMSSRGSGVGTLPPFLNYTVSEQTTDSQQDPEGDQATQLLEERLLVKASDPRMSYLRHTVIKVRWNANDDVLPSLVFTRDFNKCNGETIPVPTPPPVP